jgi:hypothetical protein
VSRHSWEIIYNRLIARGLTVRYRGTFDLMYESIWIVDAADPFSGDYSAAIATSIGKAFERLEALVRKHDPVNRGPGITAAVSEPWH